MEYLTLVDLLHSIVRLGTGEPTLTLNDALIGGVMLGTKASPLSVLNLDFLAQETRRHAAEQWEPYGRSEARYRYAMTYSLAAGWLHHLLANAAHDDSAAPIRWWKRHPETGFPVLDTKVTSEGMRFLVGVASYRRIEGLAMAEHVASSISPGCLDEGHLSPPPRLVDAQGLAACMPPGAGVFYDMIQGMGLIGSDAVALVNAAGLSTSSSTETDEAREDGRRQRFEAKGGKCERRSNGWRLTPNGPLAELAREEKTAMRPYRDNRDISADIKASFARSRPTGLPKSTG